MAENDHSKLLQGILSSFYPPSTSCHHSPSFGWPLPSPSGDDVIYEQPLMQRGWGKWVHTDYPPITSIPASPIQKLSLISSESTNMHRTLFSLPTQMKPWEKYFRPFYWQTRLHRCCCCWILALLLISLWPSSTSQCPPAWPASLFFDSSCLVAFNSWILLEGS